MRYIFFPQALGQVDHYLGKKDVAAIGFRWQMVGTLLLHTCHFRCAQMSSCSEACDLKSMQKLLISKQIDLHSSLASKTIRASARRTDIDPKKLQPKKLSLEP